MSYRNPSQAQVIANSVGGDYFYDYHKAAMAIFYGKHKRKATLDDAQELRDTKVKGYLKKRSMKRKQEDLHAYDRWYAEASMDGSLAYNGVTDDF